MGLRSRASSGLPGWRPFASVARWRETGDFAGRRGDVELTGRRRAAIEALGDPPPFAASDAPASRSRCRKARLLRGTSYAKASRQRMGETSGL